MISDVSREESLISKTVTTLEKIRIQMRGLVKLLDPPDRKTVYSNFHDTVYPTTNPNNSISAEKPLINYYKRVQSIIQENQLNPVVLKIKRNEVLNETDINQLENFIVSSDYQLDRQTLEATFTTPTLSEFVRSIVGLDRDAALQAFSHFMSSRNLNAAQLHFVHEIIEHVVRLGYIESDKLYEQPFRDMHFEGVNGLFNKSDTEEIIEILSTIRKRATLLA